MELRVEETGQYRVVPKGDNLHFHGVWGTVREVVQGEVPFQCPQNPLLPDSYAFERYFRPLTSLIFYLLYTRNTWDILIIKNGSIVSSRFQIKNVGLGSL